MPNHWESSARPLFVKTVFVNGNRHAVLFEKDPLLRCGNSPLKKTSRPCSSISFASDFSISTSESEEGKSAKLRQRQSKDLSTELQSCLVKLKLASVSQRPPSRGEKCFCNSKEAHRSKGRGSSKQRRQKWNRERRKQYECEESNELSERKNDCYVYNLENYKGKKNYCFVKISSQSPKLILNCCCEENKSAHTNKNMVISATIHNLVMTPGERGDVFPLENAELYWNNYVTRSYYDSLSERVLRWLEMARKRKKQKEKLDSTSETDSKNVTEQIFSEKTFAEEGKKTDSSYNRIVVNGGKITRNNTSVDVESEVGGEPNVETLLSKDRSNSPIKTFHKPVEFQSKPVYNSKSSPVDLSNLRSNKSPLKIQDLFLDCELKENSNKRKMKETRSNKFKEVNSGEREDLVITALNTWAEGMSMNSPFVDKSYKQPRCFCNGKSDEDKIKNQILTENLPERNQKSINNLNNTRARPVLIQNLLSPQQPDKMSYLQEEKIVWASEKNTGRPQLHIFMPSNLLKDQSDDSLSECENYLNL